jgi:DNA-binding NarL/FixJ family response regulator
VIRVLVADDHPVMRNGLAALLGSLDDMEVVALAGDGQAAVREAVLHRPDVVLLDLHMPGADGFHALRLLSKAVPDAAVCILTMLDDDDSLFAAMRAGARGYLLKGAEQEEIERAVRAVAAGEAVFGPGVAKRVLAQLTSPGKAESARPFPELTPREVDVLDLLAAGEPLTQIAGRLGLAPKTIRNLVSSILAKLHLADRGQAALIARDAGLGRPSPIRDTR